MEECQECSGEGSRIVYVITHQGTREVLVECEKCDGLGIVEDE